VRLSHNVHYFEHYRHSSPLVKLFTEEAGHLQDRLPHRKMHFEQMEFTNSKFSGPLPVK